MKKQIWFRILLILAIVTALLAAICALSAYRSAVNFQVTHYTLSEPLQAPLRIVQLSDLHHREFGENNERLLECVRDLRPDIILMTGDMINGDEEEIGALLSLIERMKELAPVYFGYGNREKDWEKSCGSMRGALEEGGATVLDAEYLDVECRGNALRIGGYAGYNGAPVMTTSDPQQQDLELQFAEAFENTDRLKILLDHVPTGWLDWEYMDDYPVDLVFCGHYHGGQVRLPLLGGLFAPNVGWFPPYTKGIFSGRAATVILSAGLGSDPGVPRINNPGEVVCVDLLPAE